MNTYITMGLPQILTFSYIRIRIYVLKCMVKYIRSCFYESYTEKERAYLNCAAYVASVILYPCIGDLTL